MSYNFNPFTGKLDVVTDPAGSDTQVQFNSSGAFGASSNLTYNYSTNLLTNTGDIRLSNASTYTTTLQTITATANRTISLPDATGTVALVAGSSGQLTYNLSGAQAGLSTSSIDGSGNITLSARYINSTAGAASAPPESLTGTWFTGGTSTTTKPQFLIEPTGTTSTAWSTSGTGIGVNAASGFAGNLLDLQVNGTSQLSVTNNGTINAPSTLALASNNNTLITLYNTANLSLSDRINDSYVFAGKLNSACLRVGYNRTSVNYYDADTQYFRSGNGTNIRVLIDSSGRMLVGATSTTATSTAIFQGNSGGATNAALLYLQRGQAASAPIAAGANIGYFEFTDNAGNIFAEFGCSADATSGTNNYPGRLVFTTTASGASTPTERLRITNDGVIGYTQPTPVAVDTTATLTVANLKTGIITSSTAAAVTMTLPTGTLTEGGFSGLYTNFTFEWSVINTGATNDVTIAAGTAHTIVGSATIKAGTSGRFASSRTAANTFVSYRIS